VAYASAEDVLSRWIGPNKPDDDDLVENYLEDAETIIRFENPDLDQRIVDETNLRSLVNLVERRMVTRALKNPELLRQVAEGTGPFTESKTYGTETLAGLELTDGDRVFLARPGAGGEQKAFTIDLTQKRPPLADLQGALVNGPDWMAPRYPDAR
jgi:hypothetical protein